MARGEHIRNPVEWGADVIRRAGHGIEETGRYVGGVERTRYALPPRVRRIGFADLRRALVLGFEDFTACRTDVIMLFAIYPLAGLVLARLLFGYDMLPLVFPLAAGFALIGPAVAVGLYEMSRQREMGVEVSWAHAFAVLRSPKIGAIVTLALLLLAIFGAWLGAAHAVYLMTLGPDQPVSVTAFARQVLYTPDGWTMVAIGFAVGFLFAVAVLMISVVSFPLLLDRDVGLPTAMGTSIRACLANPVPMAAWGLVVALGLALGSLPLLLGLAVAVPVLGHATWHLYRAVVEH